MKSRIFKTLGVLGLGTMLMFSFGAVTFAEEEQPSQNQIIEQIQSQIKGVQKVYVCHWASDHWNVLHLPPQSVIDEGHDNHENDFLNVEDQNDDEAVDETDCEILADDDEDECVLTAPSLVSPTGGTTVLAAPLTLDWSDVAEAESYKVEVSTTDDFAVLAVNETVTGSSFVVNLTPGTTYFWRVTAIDEDVDECDEMSVVGSFVTDTGGIGGGTIDFGDTTNVFNTTGGIGGGTFDASGIGGGVVEEGIGGGVLPETGVPWSGVSLIVSLIGALGVTYRFRNIFAA